MLRLRHIGFYASASVAAGSLLVGVLGVSPAAASPGQVKISILKPDIARNTQVLTVTLEGTTVGEVVWATYRKIPNPDAPQNQLDDKCAETMATNKDTLFFGPLVSPGTVSRTRVITLGLFVVCPYYAAPGLTGRADAQVASNALLGQWIPAAPPAARPAPRRTSVTLTVTLMISRTRTSATVLGVVGGPTTGSVVMQRKVGRGWVTIASFPVRRSRFAGALPATRGQIVRAVLLAAPGWQASRSAELTLR